MRIPKKYDAYVDDIDRDDDGIWIWLVRGCCYDQQGQHLIHEDTLSQAVNCLASVRKCNCTDCTEDTGYFD